MSITKYAIFNSAFAFLIAFILTPIMINLAYKYQLLDVPKGRKQHVKSTPFLGGVSVFIAFWGTFFIGLVLASFVQPFGLSIISHHDLVRLAQSGIGNALTAIFVASTLMLATGFFDDKLCLKPSIKLMLQIVAAVILVSGGLRINLLGDNLLINSIGTIFWIVIMLNAFNFIDSINGHCSGITIIALLFYFWISLIVRQPLISFFVMTLAGATFGFFIYNYRKAKIFLGDNGSLFLGTMMAVITLLCDYRSGVEFSISPLIPIIIFGVPIYDTVSVIFVRVIKRKKIWDGDRNHFAHRLMNMGMDSNQAVHFSFLVCILFGLSAVLFTQLKTKMGIAVNFTMFMMMMFVIAYLEYYAYRQSRKYRLLSRFRSDREI